MEGLSKSQLVLLVLLVSFVTSVATALVTATLIDQAPKPVTNTIQRVIERVSINNNEEEQEEVEVVVTRTEDIIINVVKEVSPAVVSVIATKDLPVVEQCFIDPFGGDQLFEQFFKGFDFKIPQLCEKGTERRQVSSGTGFFVKSSGLIVTNRHVVEDRAASYSVILNDGRKLEALVMARDPLQDLAILKVEGDNFPIISLGNSDALNIGRTVIAIGNALGEFQNTVSVGVISGLRRTIIAQGSAGGAEELRSVIQTDAAINPGNSGGPLISLDGRAIGINTAIAEGAENIGFALPVNLIKKDLADIEATGKIIYPFLGVRYMIVTPDIQKEKGLAVDYGALLVADDKDSAVAPDSPASRIELKAGDIILEFGREKVTREVPLALLIQKYRVGDEVEVKVLRGKEELIKKVTLAEFITD